MKKTHKDELSEELDGIVYAYSAEWIKELESEAHWQLYWNQINLLNNYAKSGEHILEIGVGTGFTANYLRSKGFTVSTFDIDERKKPDILGNIVTHDFTDVYDHILAFEVFEHIPYEKFISVLPKLRNASRKSLCLSVPIARREWFNISLKLPFFSEKKLGFSKRKKQIIEHHFWEVDFGTINKRTLVRDLSETGFESKFVHEKLNRLFIGCERR